MASARSRQPGPVVAVDWLREHFRDMEIVPVVESDRELRLVRDRNHTEKARVLDAVLLDAVWELLDAAGAGRAAVTEAMVERAAAVLWEAERDLTEAGDWESAVSLAKDEYRKTARIVLRAALHSPAEGQEEASSDGA